MSSFQSGFIEAQPLSQTLVQTVRAIGEYKGKEALFREQSPQLLETLRQVAVIQSTEASNRLEGITASAQRLRQLVAHKVTPQNRSEQEIAGYRDVLNIIHANYRFMAFTPSLVLQLHRDLTQFVPSRGGIWKPTDNDITETWPDGSQILRFKPVPAYLTPEAMRQLHERFNALWRSQTVEPLLLIATYVLDFLCIHPFLDGNGRMARLLTLLLLYQAGYEVGRYISLEQVIEQTRDSYYDTLYQSSHGWHTDTHSLLPWWDYFLGIVLGAYRAFEERVGVVTTHKGAKQERVVEVVERLPPQFRLADVEKACPGISRPTINRVLAQLRQDKRILCIKAGRDAVWEKIEPFEQE